MSESDTTTRRMRRRALTMAIMAVLLPPTLAAVGRDVATAARPTPGAPPPSLAGAYVGGLYLGVGGATRVWPVFEPSQLGGVVSGTYGSVTTDRRRPGWLGRQGASILRVRGALIGVRLTFDALDRGVPWYHFVGEVRTRAHTIVGTMRSLTAHNAATYPLTFYDCRTAPRAITPCASAHTR